MKTVLSLAERQYSLVTRGQALTLGMTKREFDRAVGAGRFVRVHREVYRVAGASET